MHEKSLAFLRRSVMPAPAKSEKLKAVADQDKKVRPRKKRLRHLSVSQPMRKISSVSASGEDDDKPSLPELVVKSGPKESRDAKRKAMLDDTDLYKDAADTLRGILEADAVAFVKMDDYQLYFRRSDSLEPDLSSTDDSHENPLFQFIAGKPWPERYEPVVNHVPISGSPPVVILGTSAETPNAKFNFLQSGTEGTLAEYLAAFLKTRRFWWDKSNQDDTLCSKMMGLMPDTSETVMVNAYFTGDGRVRVATFASWNRPPSSFIDTSTVSLPFIQILGGISMAARSVRKIRAMEQSQISYSNLQAQ